MMESNKNMDFKDIGSENRIDHNFNKLLKYLIMQLGYFRPHFCCFFSDSFCVKLTITYFLQTAKFSFVYFYLNSVISGVKLIIPKAVLFLRATQTKMQAVV